MTAGANNQSSNSSEKFEKTEPVVDLVDELLEMYEKNEKIEIRCSGDIRYSDHRGNRGDKEYKIINHKDLNLEFFQKQRGFYEIHRDQFIRPHFDFDFKDSDEIDEDELFNIIDFLDSYKPICGEYELQGYSNIKDVYRQMKQFANVFEFKKDAKKPLSFHVVYRGKFVDRDDWYNYHKDAKVIFNGKRIPFDEQVYVRNMTRDKKTGEIKAAQHPFRMMSYDAADYKSDKASCKYEWKIINKNGLNRERMKLKNFVNSIVTPSQDDVKMECKDLMKIDNIRFEFKDKYDIKRDYTDEEWKKDKNTIMYRYFQYFNDKCFKGLLRNRKVVWMKYSETPKTYGYYDPKTGNINIAPVLNFKEARSTLIHEMCHAAQFEIDHCKCNKPHCVAHFQARAMECIAITGITVRTTAHDDDDLEIIEDTSMIGDESEKVEQMDEKLFDAIVNGFANLPDGVEIHHTQGGQKIVDRISLFSLFTRLFACERFGIHRNVIHAGIKKIQKNGARITANAWEHWDEQVDKHEMEPHDQYKSLIKQLKKHHPDYYDEFLKPITPEPILRKLGDHETFENSNYNINQFLNDFSDGVFKSTSEMGKKLALCVAINTDSNGYIAKSIAKKVSSVRTYTSRQIKELMGDNKFKYDLSEEDKEKLRSQKKKVKDSVEISLYEVLNKVEYRKLMKKYDGVELLSDDPNTYQVYKPPVGVYDEKLIQEWLSYMREDRIENPEAFNELLSSHAFRFRHPNEFLAKFFINYGSNGGEGKGFMNACFESVYPKLASVACRQEQIEDDMFNGWISSQLLVWIEEAESGRTNFMDKKIHTRIKQLTTKATQTRRMHHELESDRNWAIFGMNTNDPTLYGLIRGDKALIDRLVILKFKKGWSDGIKFNAKNHSFTDNPNFAYSLYHYLKFKHEIPDTFCVRGYHGEDKNRILNELRMNSKTVIEEWLKDNSGIFINKKMRDGGEILKIASVQSVIDSYNMFVKNGNNRFAPTKVNETLINYGFQEKNMKIGQHQARHWFINSVKFDELIKKLNGDDECIELIDDDDMDEEFDSNSL